MRFNLLDLFFESACLLIGTILGCQLPSYLPRYLRWVTPLVGAVGVYFALIYPFRRGLKLYPMVLPGCPYCKKLQDGFQTLGVDWPRVSLRCPTNLKRHASRPLIGLPDRSMDEFHSFVPARAARSRVENTPPRGEGSAGPRQYQDVPTVSRQTGWGFGSHPSTRRLLACNACVRQEKSGWSCQLRGTDHGNCSFAMKPTWHRDGQPSRPSLEGERVSRNASEPIGASLSQVGSGQPSHAGET
jgi:hypothetical protein